MASFNQTQVVELQDVSNYLGSTPPSMISAHSSGERISISPPENAVSALERWNQSKVNICKTASTFFGFLVMGANDAAYGAIIPSLQTHYNISYTIVSLVFLSPFIGYVAAAVLNNFLHKTVGQRGVAMLGPGAHLVSYIIISVHPPYPVLVIVFILAGFGNGILDAAWNAWIGNLANPNEILGFLHGFYGVGATISPLIATTLITRGGFQWYAFYYFMIGASVIEILTSTASFWHESGEKYRMSQSSDSVKGATRKALKTRVAWVSAFFLLLYVGIEVALGGWIVTFMIEVRNGGHFESGLIATGFWLGITVGRVTLGFITPRLGENLAICIYLGLAMAMQILFWLVPSFTVSSVAVAFVGVFLGPLFPAVVVAATKLLPANLHVAAIGFAAAFGGGGAAILPFAVGAIAQAAGVRVLQPIILSLLGVALGLWFIGMPSISSREGDEKGKMHKTKAVVRKYFYGCFAERL